jgi:hypothetical protein
MRDGHPILRNPTKDIDAAGNGRRYAVPFGWQCGFFGSLLPPRLRSLTSAARFSVGPRAPATCRLQVSSGITHETRPNWETFRLPGTVKVDASRFPEASASSLRDTCYARPMPLVQRTRGWFFQDSTPLILPFLWRFREQCEGRSGLPGSRPAQVFH